MSEWVEPEVEVAKKSKEAPKSLAAFLAIEHEVVHPDNKALHLELIDVVRELEEHVRRHDELGEFCRALLMSVQFQCVLLKNEAVLVNNKTLPELISSAMFAGGLTADEFAEMGQFVRKSGQGLNLQLLVANSLDVIFPENANEGGGHFKRKIKEPTDETGPDEQRAFLKLAGKTASFLAQLSNLHVKPADQFGRKLREIALRAAGRDAYSAFDMAHFEQVHGVESQLEAYSGAYAMNYEKGKGIVTFNHTARYPAPHMAMTQAAELAFENKTEQDIDEMKQSIAGVQETQHLTQDKLTKLGKELDHTRRHVQQVGLKTVDLQKQVDKINADAPVTDGLLITALVAHDEDKEKEAEKKREEQELKDADDMAELQAGLGNVDLDSASDEDD